VRAAGARRDFSELPPSVREQIERALGSRVVAAETQPSGFSPGIAARVCLANGDRAFLKAVGPEPNPQSPEFHRRELMIVASLPADAPVPRFLTGVDEDGWVALAFEDVDGRHPAQPWRQDELERVFDAAHGLVDSLTASPVAVGQAGEMFRQSINSWRLLRTERSPGLDEWSGRYVEQLAELEERVADLVGETLLHLDIREDNLLLAESRVYFVDWPHAHVGPSWIDAVCFAPSVAMQGGPDPEDVLAAWPGGADADPDEVNAALASIAGFFTHRALLPPAPGLPGLREFQAAQGAVARAWLARRLGYG
jgi:aminoglycoside phosphotransferase (APT) family kinase protein